MNDVTRLLVPTVDRAVKAKQLSRNPANVTTGDLASRAADYANFQKSHCNCIVCGTNNPISLGLEFDIKPDGSVCADFKGRALFQGYRGILHGGIIAALLDAAMTHCLFHHGIQAVTGDLQVRFLKPVPFSALLHLRAKISSSFPPLHKLDSELTCNKHLMARGRARFIDSTNDKM